MTELSITLPNGAEIRIIGADDPDALRGSYFDGVVMDEVARMKPDVWGEIVRPALADRGGFAIFIGTPKGRNLFYELYEKAQTAAGWFAGLWRVDQTGVIPEAELDAVREELTVGQYRQEFLCDFSASSDDALITIDLVDASVRRAITPGDVMGAEMVIGVDPARFGGDRAVISPRRGLYMYPQSVFSGLDNMELADRVAAAIHEHDPDGVCVDAGAGAGVIDRLRQLGYRDLVLEICRAHHDLHGEHLVAHHGRRAEPQGEEVAGGGFLQPGAHLRLRSGVCLLRSHRL